MTGYMLILAALILVAGCRTETARPVPVPEQGPEPPASPSPVEPQRPLEERDAGADGEPMSAQEARERASSAARHGGILEVLGEASQGGTKNVLAPGDDFSDEEIEAIEKALGTLEKKPPPPLAPE